MVSEHAGRVAASVTRVVTQTVQGGAILRGGQGEKMSGFRLSVRVGAALAISVGLVASLVGLATPAQAAAPSVAFFRGDTLAITADPAPGGSLNQLRATAVLNLDPGVTVTGMKVNALGPTSGSYGAVQGTVRTLSGSGSNYTVVDAAFTPGTGNWPGFTVDARQLTKQACVRFNTSAGETADQCWTYRTASETETAAVEVPVPWDNHNTTQGTVFTSSPAAFHVASTCDDNDTGTPGWGQCDQAKLRLRNIGTNQTFDLKCGTHTTGSPACETRSGAPAGAFNADDNTRRDFDFSVADLARGKWVIEALYGNEDNSYFNGGTYEWSWLGYFFVNPTAPTVGLSGSASAGSAARPNTGATVTYTAAVSADAQILDWDLDGSTGNGFETRERASLNFAGDAGGTPSFTVGQTQKAVDTTGKAGGASCGVRAQVIDNGVLAATDTPATALSRTSGIAAAACTVNNAPAGANQGPVAAVAGGAGKVIALANTDADGDARTCELVSAPARGSVSGGTPGVSCSRTYTANSDPSGVDSFTYRVKDDHGGTSATSTVTIDVADAPLLPSAPQIGSVTAGDGKVTVGWAAPTSDGGAAITGYVVTPYIAGVGQPAQTFNSTATTQDVTGLTNGTTYTFKVAAVNSVGTGPQSAESAAVTPVPSASVPGAPTAVVAARGNGQVSLEWVAPASNGGAAISGYTVTPYIGSTAQAPRVFASTATTQVISGLTNKVGYTFTVSATNVAGTGPESAPSALTTPVVWVPFASVDAFIDQQFQDFANRTPTGAERTAWRSALNAETKTPAQLIEELRSAPYWEGVEAPVIRLYSAYLQRTPDTSGLNFWINRRRSGNYTLAKISASFADSSEFKRKYGALSNEDFVTLIYEDVLERPKDPSGFAFWVRKLDNGTGRGQVMLNFSDSNEYVTKQASEVKAVTTYLGMLRRTPTSSEMAAVVARLDGGTPITTIISEILASASYEARF